MTADSINSGGNGSDATSVAFGSAFQTEAQQQRTQVHDLLKGKKRSSPLERKTSALRRTKYMSAAKAGFLLATVFVLLLASVKLRQCRHDLLKKTSSETEGNTRRRLAEGWWWW
ncbi:hypothetical protein NCLIV_006930 [Neospora caninum Liverpool]|uniref:Toxoplasma gondii family B protein n=1 Tax=Neospora caninum (strain Liverpool) TaxID=572307 RepID=F0V9Q7_NEOCL|nr:hypothetical protein NCLIV_006930 [Neospora caninum Liverpool]CBZ50218.1 hypothetical protein NCLIV_006930 [Neospora caninum Liverpool]|eukprot:XP_003880253.1 hypothetical protein NCLIV_006930 [Neospora caninum Liverpool]